MALSTHPFIKGPQLTFGDRVELGVATAEKVLNTLGNIPLVNTVSGVLKLSLATTQILAGSIMAFVNQINYLAKRIFYNELVPSADRNQYLKLQDRLNKSLKGSCQSLGRGVVMIVPFANAFFYKLDSRRYKMKNVEEEDSLTYYPAERKVLLHRLNENPKLRERLKTKYFNVQRIDKFDKAEHYLNGIRETFNYVAAIPTVNIFVGYAHIAFGIVHLVASLSIGAFFKLGEAFSKTPEMNSKMRHIGNRFMGHGVQALSHICNGLFEVTYVINNVFLLLKINFFSYKGSKKISAPILAYEKHLLKDKLRRSQGQKFLRVMESAMARFEFKILNPLGKIPLVSILSGTVRIIVGVIQQVFGILSYGALHIAKQYIIEPEKYWPLDVLENDFLDFSKHGILNYCRGLAELIPFVGTAFDNNDLKKARDPRYSFRYRAELLNSNL